ncbi:MAG: RluA family pseudouridine synthase [Pirellulales bacterium]
MPQLELLYDVGPCFAFNKAPGVATQAPPQFDSMEVRVKAWLREREGKPPTDNVYLGVPHRLDRPASGVLMFTRHVRAARKISEQFERRTVKKTYWALVAGLVTPEAGTWTDYIKKVYGHPRAELVESGDPDGRPAILHYRTVGHTPHGSRLEIELETGRTHQIRVQAAARGWPVLGDAFYGCTVPFGPQHAEERQRAIALHGRSLSFVHPVSREEVTVVAPLPAEWGKE